MKDIVKNAVTIAFEVLKEVREMFGLEFSTRDVIDLSKAILMESGKNKRTEEITSAARGNGHGNGHGNGNGSKAAAVPAAALQRSVPEPQPAGNGNGNGKSYKIKDPDAPASSKQIALLDKIACEKISEGQTSMEWLLGYFHVADLKEVTKAMASTAIDELLASQP